MKRTKRSIFVLFTLFAALSLVLAACGDDEEEDPVNGDGDAPVATSTTAAGTDDEETPDVDDTDDDDAEATEEDDDAEATPEDDDDAEATEDDGDDAEATEGDDADDAGAGAGDAEAGQAIYQEMCAACHSIDGTEAIGPTWEGLWMSEVPLEDGSTVTADEAYITESIQEPGAKIHEGFSNIMPEFDLSEEEIANVIAFMQTLE